MCEMYPVIIAGLLAMCAAAVIYCVYIGINLRSLTEQLRDIRSHGDTNQLLTLPMDQRHFAALTREMNALLEADRQMQIDNHRVNQSFRESITGISHDLRTPLTTAGGYLEMAMAMTEDEECRDYLSIVAERQERVQALLGQLFEYARLEAGDLVYDSETVDGRKLLLDTLAAYYEDFVKKGQEPLLQIPESACLVRGSAEGLRRVFANLVNNALRHGSREFCFSVVPERDGYQFAFSNASEAVAQEELTHLFDRLYSRQIAGEGASTGLGLAIAREIVHQLGGKIGAQWEAGRFSVCVWLAAADADTKAIEGS